MSKLLVRTFPVETVDMGADGRTLYGKIVPYNTPAYVSSYDEGRPWQEQVMPGAFSRSIAERGQRIPLYSGHPQVSDDRHPIGRATHWDDRADALYGLFRLADTAGARDAATLIRDDMLRALSIGFYADAATERVNASGVHEHRQGHLHHVALVAEGAYPEAQVLELRTATEPPRPSLQALRLRLLALTLEDIP